MRVALTGLVVLLVVVSGLVWLAVMGYDQCIEEESVGNVVVFSSASIAQDAARMSVVFPLKSRLGIEFEGMGAGEGDLQPNEVAFRLRLSGYRRKRLFEGQGFVAGSESEVRRLLIQELIRATGDAGLIVRKVRLKYITSE